jgi:hypothetical protein
VPGAYVALQREALDRVTPRIVEAFLMHLDAAGLIECAPHAADGIYVLTARDLGTLPTEFGDDARAVVATSGTAVAQAEASGARLEHAVSLGPSAVAFRELVERAADRSGPALFQGSTVVDPTATTDYDLVLYEAEVVEGSRRRRIVWPFVVRVDDTGARHQRWEGLANLQAAEGPRIRHHPARRDDADAQAEQTVRERERMRREAVERWLAQAGRELRRLPSALTSRITDRERRQAVRNKVQAAVRERLQELDTLAVVEIGEARRLGWVHVRAAGVSPDLTEKNSEQLAMMAVTALLRADGWRVSDVHTEGRGYDLRAVQGRHQRCVEVKGIWDNASSAGIQMTAEEVLVARQQAGDYWLYVVDHCRDGGVVYGIYQNPADLFGADLRSVTGVRIPGSALAAARSEHESPCG